MKKVVLAYSGGLDTSIIIAWLRETYHCEVIAVSGDVGQGAEVEGLRERALRSGASQVFIEDLREDFLTHYAFPTLRAGAVYEHKYLLGTATARPCIARRLVEVAEREGAEAICHGCTGKGNDQVRFELTIKALSPRMKIIAPWRIWDIGSRDAAIDYAKERGIEVPVSREKNYSRDRNIWHLSHEGMDLEDPANPPRDDLFQICRTPREAPDAPATVEIGFEKGIPVRVDGKSLGPVELLETLNRLGAGHGVGIDDLVENRLVGIKSRGVYENPGGRILYRAHQDLEALCLDRETMHYKQLVALRYGELVYYGQWFSPLRTALQAFVDQTQERVTGTVKLTLYKGGISSGGAVSPYSLYSEEFATFNQDEVYDQKDAEGFINLFGLPLKVQAMQDRERAEQEKE